MNKKVIDLNFYNEISILPQGSINQFIEHKDTFPISFKDAYTILNNHKKVYSILTDTQYYPRKLLVDGYPNQNKKMFSISIREFIDVRATIIASFSVDAYTGNMYFEPKPSSEAYENGLWKIPIDEWDSQLD